MEVLCANKMFRMVNDGGCVVPNLLLFNAVKCPIVLLCLVFVRIVGHGNKFGLYLKHSLW